MCRYRRILILVAALTGADLLADESASIERLPDAPAARSIIATVPLKIEGRETPATYRALMPAGYRFGDKPALLIALHGTDDTAGDMIDFWRARKTPYRMMIVAPQGVAPGWRDDDLPTIRAMLEHLKTAATYDEGRVWLAGFSAGGAMTFHLLYAQKLPVTAAAALANYVPPSITDAQIKAHASVPVFYAVGMDDVNHERMRVGITRLREAGGDITLYRPRIGHVLSPEVGQAAMDWLIETSNTQLLDRIDETTPTASVPASALLLHEIVSQKRWHTTDVYERARIALDVLEADGRAAMEEVRTHIKADRKFEAVQTLQHVEAQYGDSPLGAEAKRIRLELETDPEVRKALAAEAAERDETDAMAMYQGAQRLVGEAQLRAAAKRCRQVIALYPDTAGARRAQTLLDTLNRKLQP